MSITCSVSLTSSRPSIELSQVSVAEQARVAARSSAGCLSQIVAVNRRESNKGIEASLVDSRGSATQSTSSALQSLVRVGPVALAKLLAVLTGQQLDVYSKEISAAQARSEALQNERIETMQKQVDQERKVAKQRKAGWILSIVGKVIAVAISAALVVVSGGAALGVAAFALAYATTDLACDVADKVRQDQGKSPCSLNALFTKMFVAIQRSSKPTQARQKFAAIAAGVTQFFLGLIGPGAGIAAARTAPAAARQIFQVGESVSSTTLTLGGQVLGIFTATNERDLAMLQVSSEQAGIDLEAIASQVEVMQTGSSNTLAALTENNRFTATYLDRQHRLNAHWYTA